MWPLPHSVARRHLVLQELASWLFSQQPTVKVILRVQFCCLKMSPGSNTADFLFTMSVDASVSCQVNGDENKA